MARQHCAERDVREIFRVGVWLGFGWGSGSGWGRGWGCVVVSNVRDTVAFARFARAASRNLGRVRISARGCQSADACIVSAHPSSGTRRLAQPIDGRRDERNPRGRSRTRTVHARIEGQGHPVGNGQGARRQGHRPTEEVRHHRQDPRPDRVEHSGSRRNSRWERPGRPSRVGRAHSSRTPHIEGLRFQGFRIRGRRQGRDRPVRPG